MKDPNKTSLTDRPLKVVMMEAFEQGKTQIPEEALHEMQQATEKLRERDYKELTLQIGDHFPDAALLTDKAQPILLSELIENKKVIIVFYRGSWCPYCNLELRYYDQLLAKPENRDVVMLAISPEKPDQSLSREELDALHFKVLSDTNNTLAKKLGLVFQLPENIQHIYANFGIDLETSQGNNHQELPVPATYIVDSFGKVAYVDLDVDYTTRPEAQEVLLRYRSAL